MVVSLRDRKNHGAAADPARVAGFPKPAGAVCFSSDIVFAPHCAAVRCGTEADAPWHAVRRGCRMRDMRNAYLMLLVLICSCATCVAAQNDASLLPETTTRISEHVYAIMGFPNIAIVVGTRGTLVVDTGLGPRNGATIERVVKKLSRGGLLYLTTTHFHPEHAAGEG